MDVTYFIGNGFDLSLGLRTGYRSFLREYLKKPVKVARPNDPNAAAGLTAVQARAIRRGKRMICEHLRKGCINWSDMEAALGECTVYFHNTPESRKAYATLRKDIVTELSQYLIGQARMNSGGVIRRSSTRKLPMRLPPCLKTLCRACQPPICSCSSLSGRSTAASPWAATLSPLTIPTCWTSA